MKGTTKRIFVLGGILGIFLIPFPTEVVPEYDLRIVDQNGIPLENASIEQACSNYTYSSRNICGEALDARQRTDENGVVRFSSKAIWMSLLSRMGRAAFHYLMTAFHGSLGLKSTLFIHTEYEIDPSVIELDSGPRPDGTIVVKRR
jgi:protocatechuate 3,4-dioxygenase beta subunit